MTTTAPYLPRHRLVIQRADDRVLRFTLRDAGGVPVGLDGASVAFTAKLNIDDTDESALIRKTTAGGGITIPGDGQVEVRLAAADTAELSATTFLVWDLEVTDALGEVRTAARGTLRVELDVTRHDQD
jgi:hypothetical protein